MWEDNRGWTFSPEGSVIMDYGWKKQFEVKNILMMNLFLTNMQLFTSQVFNWWTGVVWITCGWLWCFLSALWTLILTAPIHCRGSIGGKVMWGYIYPSLLQEDTNSSTSLKRLNLKLFICFSRCNWLSLLLTSHSYFALVWQMKKVHTYIPHGLTINKTSCIIEAP